MTKLEDESIIEGDTEILPTTSTSIDCMNTESECSLKSTLNEKIPGFRKEKQHV